MLLIKEKLRYAKQDKKLIVLKGKCLTRKTEKM